MAFAFLIGPPRTLTRHDGMRVHSAVCEKLGVDDFGFRYTSQEPPAGGGSTSRGFVIALERQQGRGTFQVTLDNPGFEAPVRMLPEYRWPPSREHVFQDLDLAAEGAFEALGEGWQRVMAETRIRAQLESRGASAVAFLAKDLLHFSEGEIGSLGSLPSFLSIRYETPPGHADPANPLANPKREVTLEVLREDRRSLYVEVMSQWPQIAATADGTLQLDASRIRGFKEAPSEYLRDSVEYLTGIVLPFFNRT